MDAIAVRRNAFPAGSLVVRAALALALLAGATARAHTPSPEDVVAMIGVPAARAHFAITGVERDARLPRLLVIRVGAGWASVAAAERVNVAEEWWSLWRHAVPQGIVAVLDAETDAALVNFDVEGGARLVAPARDRPAPPPR